MAASPYNVRSKLNTQGISLNTTASNSPLSRQVPRSPLRIGTPAISLSLRTVIGTTTETPNGFSCHANSNRFAICAGSAAILAEVDASGQVSQRFFRARPTVSSVNPVYSFYDTAFTGGTTDGRRKTGMNPRPTGFGLGSTGSPRRDWNEDSGSKTWTARERVKATSSVSLSPNGSFLAFGETGYCPRVLIFSTADDSKCDIPLSIITEHTFGVRAVAFSPNSRYLATLGEANDGFLFVWAFDSRTGTVNLHSTNKCTSNVYDMAWCGDSLITVGTRHVKVWRIPDRNRISPTKPRGRRTDDAPFASPGPQALLGRNCLLGALANSIFTCVTAISTSEAIVCTDTGQACMIGGTENVQEIKVTKETGFGIFAVTARLTTGEVLFGGADGHFECADFETLRRLARPAKWPSSGPQSPGSSLAPSKVILPGTTAPTRVPREQSHRTIALGWLENSVISIDSNCNTRVLVDDDSTGLRLTETFESHHESVQGVHTLPNDARLGEFFTWSQSGKVNFWNADGKLHHSQVIAVENLRDEIDEIPNELRVVQASADARHFAAGDKLGVLKVVRTSDWTVRQEIRAHGAEITDIALHERSGTHLIATCGRDRIVQLFALKWQLSVEGSAQTSQDSRTGNSPLNGEPTFECHSIELLQTMDDHVGAVGQILFSNEGARLLSCSADRTVIVRERVMREGELSTSIAFIGMKVITLRSSPTSMSLVPGEDNIVVASTMDRQILKLDLSSGTQVEAFKVMDSESEETAIMSSIHVSNQATSDCPRLLVGSSSTDKSIRVYDYDQNILLTRESSHTEGISGLAMREEVDATTGMKTRTVFSTGLDGTIMIWNLMVLPPPTSTPLQELTQGQALQIDDKPPLSGAPITLRPPLRKVLSKSDLADFAFLDPITKSLTPVRDQSPPRLRKKTSRYALAPNKIGLTDSPSLPPLKRSITAPDRNSPSQPPRDRSPSPTNILRPNRTTRQQSPTNPSSGAEGAPSAPTNRQTTRSPSPPPNPKSAPTTPKTSNRANNARLRRPPSIPSDLNNSQPPLPATPSRRKSLNTNAAADPHNTGPASQHLSRSLRAYRKKISVAGEQLQLEEVETELLATLQSVRERKAKIGVGGGSGRSRSRKRTKAATESDMESLAQLMEKTGVQSSSST